MEMTLVERREAFPRSWAFFFFEDGSVMLQHCAPLTADTLLQSNYKEFEDKRRRFAAAHVK